MFSTLSRFRYSLFMLVKKVSSEKTCFQTGTSQMLFPDVGCVRRELLWAYTGPSGSLYAWSRDYVRSRGGVSLDSITT